MRTLCGYDISAALEAGRAGRFEHGSPGNMVEGACLYAGDGVSSLAWRSEAVPSDVDLDSEFRFNVHAILRRRRGGFARFEFLANDRPVATVDTGEGGDELCWTGPGGRVEFAEWHLDHNLDRCGCLSIVLPASAVAPGQAVRFRIRAGRRTGPARPDDDWPGYLSSRGFFLLLALPAPQCPHDLRLTLESGSVISSNWRGFGVQGDLFLTNDTYPGMAASTADRQRVEQRILAMRPQLVRLFFRLDWWEPVKGCQTPESKPMADLIHTLRIYQAADAEVIINGWNGAGPAWTQRSQEQELAGEKAVTEGRRPVEFWASPRRIPHPDQRQAFAQSWAGMIRYLREDCALTCVRYTDMYNEPNGGGLPPRMQGGIEFEEYAHMARLLDKALRGVGQRDEVAVIGPDEVNTRMWVPRAAASLDDVLDAYTAHIYTAGNAVAFAAEVCRYRWLLEETCDSDQAHGCGARKPFLLPEFSSSHFEPVAGLEAKAAPGDSFEHGLFLAEAAIRAVAEGINGIAYWNLCDCPYNQFSHLGPDVNRIHGLWRFHDQDLEPRPSFYAWSLLTRYTVRGSDVLAVRVEGDRGPAVAAVALRAPGARQPTLLLAHRSPRDLAVELETGQPHALWTRFVYERQAVPTPDQGLIPPQGQARADARGMLAISLPAESFTVLAPAQSLSSH